MNLYTVSDKIVFSILKDIKVGHLELTNYDGKNYSFGNIKDTLKANIKIKNSYDAYFGGSGYLRNADMILENVEIDFEESSFSSAFKINNPDVKATCGCGSSFS